MVLLGEEINDEILFQLQNRIFHLLSPLTSSHTYFPGGQPISFRRHHLSSALLSDDYFVCEKSDGLRYLLYFSIPPDGPCAFLIDRNWRVECFPGWSLVTRDHKVIHNDTLLDGELLIEENRFLIFDCLLCNGEQVFRKSLPDRLAKVQNHVVEPFLFLTKCQPDYRSPFSLELKEMWKAYGIKELLERVIPQQKHANDGLIFTPVHEPYKAGTWPTLLKWKPPELNTVDFGVRKCEKGYELMIGRRGKLEHFAFTDDPHAPDHVEKIIECNMVDGIWTFVRGRPDKLLPNDISVAEKVVESIKERVTKDDLCDILNDIHKSWKLRESQPNQVNHPRADHWKSFVKPEPIKQVKRKFEEPVFEVANLEWKSFEEYSEVDGIEDHEHDLKRRWEEREADGEQSTEVLDYS